MKIIYENVYHIYNYKGNILIAKGNIVETEPLKRIHFRKENGEHSFGVTDKKHNLIKPLTLNRGSHVWCKTKEDIEKAIELIMNHKNERINKLRMQADKTEQYDTKVIWK